jgi:hypothetical protein
METNERKENLSMSMTFLPTVLLAMTIMNVDAESLPYYDPPPSWIPSYSYAFKGASSILREKKEILMIPTHGPSAPH